MARDRLSIALVGHLDHGKSTLIGRLLYDTGSIPPDRMEQIRHACREQGCSTELAYFVDQLKEEREERATMDTCQVFFRTAEREYVLIDAPGHRRFLRNMLTGASQAEAAILVADAQEGLGEQTRRHAFLLSLLGIEQCVVAINKTDLVGYAEARFRELRDVLRQLFERIGLHPVAFVPISAKLGDNVVGSSSRTPWYGGQPLLAVLEGMRVARETGLPTRFCVQDVYDIDGRRIAAGRVESGTLEAGARMVALPERTVTTVLSIERFRSDRAAAEPGECIGITLPNNFAPRRGQVLCDLGALPSVVPKVWVRLFWMSGQPLRKGESLTLRIGTQEATCQVDTVTRRIDSSSLEVLEEGGEHLEETEVGDLGLAVDPPIIVELPSRNPSLGRVVLERSGSVVGAGVIVGL